MKQKTSEQGYTATIASAVRIDSRAGPKLSVAQWSGGLILGFFVSPMALLLLVIKAPGFTIKRIGITMFCVAYSMTMLLGPSTDGTKHLLRAEYFFTGMSFGEFLQGLVQIFTFEGNRAGMFDPFIHCISYISFGVFDSQFLFFPLVALVYGWFFSGSILIALRSVRLRNISYSLAFMIALAILLRGIQDIQAVRMWTAMWMCVYGVLRYCETRSVKSLVPIFLAPLVHFSFLIIAPLTLIILFFRKRRKLIAWTFLATAVFSVNVTGVDPDSFDRNALLESRQGYFKSEEDMRSRPSFGEMAQTTSWHNAATRTGIPRIGYSILAATILLSGFLAKGRKEDVDILMVGIALLAFSNISFGLPALSGRVTLYATTLILLGYIMARTNRVKTQRRLKYPLAYLVGVNMSILFMLPMLLFSLSTITHYFSAYMFVLPWFVVLESGANLTVKEFVYLFL